MSVKAELQAVTDRIIERSAKTRAAYMAACQANMRPGPRRRRLSEGNLAHAAAACPVLEKTEILGASWPNIGIVTAYNDMLSAHQPFDRFPEIIKHAARRNGATAQVAGGVPAMCDGVTQGQDGMELSLFSRDIIARGTAIALSHDCFDAVIHLGVCDKIVPGLLIAALRYGYLPHIFAPAGPMPSGIPNPEKARIRQLFAAGEIGREELLKAEAASYHAPGTCTFYGTANTNQMLMEIMGMQLPGSSFIHPNTPLRDAMTAQTTRRAVQITNMSVGQGGDFTPACEVIDERAIVNGLVGLMATGGSTNLTIHLSAIARSAGIIINWDDYADISHIVPLICRIYPNGVSDVNHFHAAGGMSYLIGELISSNLLHADVKTIAGGEGLVEYTREPIRNKHAEADTVLYRAGPTVSLDKEVLTSVDEPFRTDGGLAVLSGNLGRGVMKVSAVKQENWFVEAPAIVIDDQNDLIAMHKAGELERDFVAVLRFQGPRANGMPELHKLTPVLGLQQDKGFRVALVTDGRMSGASGKVPAAIHLHPEALLGGPLSRVETGDIVRVDPSNGSVVVLGVDLDSRTPALGPVRTNLSTLGMNMFAPQRAIATDAESGASTLGELDVPK
ncbi:phosphogluconate dehydratase [Algimonas arctica]|uniref:Phosphogluconate dehydratase n=1 Tax=Algimonas arctica TaxID=1479486 RepID=A0A8J3G233_9PROT|nr:phosphogluconate dehydratase [Algimonas arctica]GHA91240.1 phosphogluconate dehydratase [Algimonas arctica]